MVFCLQNCSDLLWKKNVLECDRQYANNLRNLEQFIWTVKGHYNFETKCSLKLFLEVSQIYFVRTVIIEFSSFEKAKEFFNSPEYQAAHKLLKDIAVRNHQIIEGS